MSDNINKLVINLVLISIKVVTFISTGFVLSTLWGWFVVPVFGAPALSIPVAIGITLLMRVVGNRYDNPDDDNSLEARADKAGLALAIPWSGLLIGWITTLFM